MKTIILFKFDLLSAPRYSDYHYSLSGTRVCKLKVKHYVKFM